MALTQSLNSPMTDPIGALGGVLREPSVQKRGAKARQLTEPLMRAESQAREDLETSKARVKKRQIDEEQIIGGRFVAGIEEAQAAYEGELGQQPERTITAFNPERATELAVLTAIMGAFAGGISGRAGLSAMKGVSEGYRTGQEDLYKREVANYEAALGQYKQKIAEAKDIYDNAVKLETAKQGAGLIELKKLDPLLQDSVITAHTRLQNFVGAGEMIKKAIELGDQAEKKVLEAGLRPTAQKTQTILDDQGQGWLVDINRYVPGTPLKIGTPGVYGLSATGAQAAAKTTAAVNQKAEGARKFNFILNRLDELYKDLRQMNAITDTDKSVGQNLTSFTATLSPVQMGQRAIGGKAQAMRDEIKALQATLLQSIMQATGMSARSLDSNKELEFYLQAATDPTKSFQTNLSAMNTLRSLYGRLEENTYPENEQELIIIRYGAYEPQKYKYEFTSNNQITRTPLPPVKPVSPTQQGARTSQPATGAEIVQQEGETRLEFLRRKRAAGQLKE